MIKGEIDQRPKRFYQDAGVAPAAGGFSVSLDGKGLRTPLKHAMTLPTEALANVIADEWRAQVERIDLQSMFNTRLSYLALDRIPVARAELAAETARYAETDLVCHLADNPAALIERQEAVWGPLRAWAAESHGVDLKPVVGIIPATQPKEAVAALRNHATALDDFRLAGLVHGVALFGSAVLGLAVERGRITAADAFEHSRLDESFQASRWGEDAEAARRTERGRAEARALDLWFSALAA